MFAKKIKALVEAVEIYIPELRKKLKEIEDIVEKRESFFEMLENEIKE